MRLGLITMKFLDSARDRQISGQSLQGVSLAHNNPIRLRAVIEASDPDIEPSCL